MFLFLEYVQYTKETYETPLYRPTQSNPTCLRNDSYITVQ